MDVFVVFYTSYQGLCINDVYKSEESANAAVDDLKRRNSKIESWYEVYCLKD